MNCVEVKLLAVGLT